MKNFKRFAQRSALFATGLAVSGASFAVDVSGAVAEIDTGNAAVGAIGVAALTVLAAAAVFKYVRRAL